MIFDGRGKPLAPLVQPEPAGWSDDAITGSCLGHSTVWMNFLGARVLTDPVFSTRVGPGVPPFILGPKRYVAPALSARQLPMPHVILVSHAHFDHLDVWSLRRFPRQTPIVTARATADIFRRHGFHVVHELDWGKSLTLETPVGLLRVTAVEVAHWGARLMRDVHRGYNGYVLERGGHRVCFAGDTAYTPAFASLNEARRPLDLMLMPIGAYDPWIRAHCSPEQAVAMARDAGARAFVPIHHETFKLSSEPMDEPARRLRAALAAEALHLLAVSVGRDVSRAAARHDQPRPQLRADGLAASAREPCPTKAVPTTQGPLLRSRFARSKAARDSLWLSQTTRSAFRWICVSGAVSSATVTTSPLVT